MTLNNSVVAGNRAPAYENLNLGYIEVGNNFIDGSALLAPLGDYGGPTQTMPPLFGSPAIDAAGATTLTSDQRGLLRNRDGDGDGNASPDIGAVEAQADFAPALAPIGLNFVGGVYEAGHPEYIPGGILSPTDRAGVVAQSNWNNLATKSGESQGLKDSSGASFSPAVVAWWRAPAIHAIAYNAQTANVDSADGKLMNGYLDSVGTAVSNAGRDLTVEANQPVVAVSQIPSQITDAGYRVLVYSDGGSDAGTRRGEFFLTSNREGTYVDVGREVVLTPTYRLTDGDNFLTRSTGATVGEFQRSTALHPDVQVGNYVQFDRMEESGFIVRTELVEGKRPPINAVQIVPNPFIVVTTAVDEDDAIPADGTGISLREALRLAPEGATIVFDPGLSGQLVGLTSQLVIDRSVAIDGTDPGGITIDGEETTRLFSVTSSGDLSLRGLTLTGGRGGDDGILGYGGGAIYNVGTALLDRCTLIDNIAVEGSYGGAINNGGSLVATNCTFSNNNGNSQGGAIRGGTVDLTHCTLVGNSATDGGGIFSFGGLTLKNTIVAGNLGSGDLWDFNSNATDPTYFVEGTNIIPTIIGGKKGGVGSVITADPLLAPLGDYGGPTQTMAPLPGSLAIDMGGSTTLTTDQRGLPRNTDGNGVNGPGIDIGAFETGAAIVVTETDDSDDSDAGSLRNALALADYFGLIRFDDDLAGPITLTSELTVARGVVIDGTDPGGIVIDGGDTTRLFKVSTGGDLTLRGLTLTGGNASTSNSGGAVLNLFGKLWLDRCTLVGNHAPFDGAAVRSRTTFSSDTQKTILTQCTVTGNDAGAFGGGVFNASGTTELHHCTVVGNTSGGGVYSEMNAMTHTELKNCIVAANTGSDVAVVRGETNTFNSGGYNLIGIGDATGAFNIEGDQIGITDPLLADLGDYGGPTQTMALLPGSPAIDAVPAGSEIAGLDADQRGFDRNTDGDGNGIAGVDIGAFETGAPIVVMNTGNADEGTLRQALVDADYGGTILFDEGVSGPITLSSELTVTRAVLIDGTDAGGIIIDGGNETRLFFVASSDSVTLRGLTLTNGNANIGGAIWNTGKLIVERCTLSGNSASDRGGAIHTGGFGLGVCRTEIA